MSNGIKISLRTLLRRKANRGTLLPKGADRAFRIAQIAARVEEIFGDTDTAQDWISASNRALGDVAPLDIMDTDAGVARTDALLTRVEQGVYS